LNDLVISFSILIRYIMASCDQTILVTGANGYVARHVVQQLLEKGFKVRGTVRSQKAASQLRETFPDHIDKQLRIALVMDLADSDSFRDIFDSSITGVIHTASPACYPADDIVKEILDPAVKSATGVLSAVERFADKKTFRRVIHLSSLAAILDYSKGKRPGYVYTGKDWNPITWKDAEALTNHVDAYEASKALSERAVWEWMQDHRPPFELTCLCPSLVLGPHVERLDRLSEVRSTVRLLWSLLVDSPELPPLEYGGFVDVRSLAAMMVAALDAPNVGGKRFLIAEHFDWQSAADAAREGIQSLRDRVPVGEPGMGREKARLSIYDVDGGQVVEATGVDYLPLTQTIIDTLAQLLEVEKRSE
jgi:NADPH-dependent methylglyoxal reductase